MTAVTTDMARGPQRDVSRWEPPGRIAELSDNAFAAFCEDIAGMFGVDIRCDRRQAHVTAVPNLREHFKKLTAVHLVKADGALEGTFHLIFDQGGLFVLSGAIVMLPESKILEDAKRGTIENAANMQDAAREVGNLLVGSWDRIFREDCPGHKHFAKTSTFLGKPWDKPEQIELQADTQVVTIVYEMAIDPYPSFTCAAVFPLTVLGSLAPAGQEAVAAQPQIEPSAGSDQDVGCAVHTNPERDGAHGTPCRAAPANEDSAQGVEAARAEPPEIRPAPTPSAKGAGTQDGRIIPSPRRSPSIDAGLLPSELASGQPGPAPGETELGTPTRNDALGPEGRCASGGSPFAFLDAAYIQSHPRTPRREAASRPGGAPDRAGLVEFLSTSAAEIMDKEVVWAGPEDTVQDVIAKMQQHNVGYVLIGSNGALEGLVSGSNVLGAVSVYLRPMFAKWRRSQDDATLGVKVKWIMSRPVRTVRPDATVAAMIESMRRYGGRCLPVVDVKGIVQGMVTMFDILLRILESDKSISWKGRPPQSPALLI